MRDRHVEHWRVARREYYTRKLFERPLSGEVDAACGKTDASEFLAPWLNREKQVCPRCGGGIIYTLAQGRLRCKDCRYTFTALTGRWINSGSLKLRDWVFLLRLFVEGHTAHQAAELAGVSYNTAFKAFTTIRFAVLGGCLDADHLYGSETGLKQYVRNKRVNFPPKSAQLKAAPVFGILEQSGWVFVDLMPGFQCETVLHFHVAFHLPLGRTGNLVHTGPYRQYQTLITILDGSLPYPAVRARTRPAIDSESFTFWSFTKRRFKHFKGVTPSRFPLYLKEMEFRYNHRDQDLMPLISSLVCATVPNID